MFCLFVASLQNTTSAEHLRAQQSGDMREIMAAILKTAGPVSTTNAVRYTKMSLHQIASYQFIEAATALAKANFGTLVTIPNLKRRGHMAFIKKLPSEIAPALAAYPGLITPEMYATRYEKAAPKAIKLPLRAKLVAMKLVAQNCFM